MMPKVRNERRLLGRRKMRRESAMKTGLGEILSDAKVILRDACRQIDRVSMPGWEGGQ